VTIGGSVSIGTSDPGDGLGLMAGDECPQAGDVNKGRASFRSMGSESNELDPPPFFPEVEQPATHPESRLHLGGSAVLSVGREAASSWLPLADFFGVRHALQIVGAER
jgi:hypothetical protein